MRARDTRRRNVVGAWAAVLAIAAITGGCAGSEGPDVDEPPAAKLSAAVEMQNADAPPDDVALRVFATGDTHGFLGPCGCDDKQYGGFARRGSYLRRVGRMDDILIDLGNAAAGTGPLRELRLTSTLEGLRLLDYDAFVPGPEDVGSADAILAAQNAKRAPTVLSANVVRADGTNPFSVFWVKGLRDRRWIVVVGVTSETAQPADGWRVLPAAEAARRAIASAALSPAAVIVAAAMPPDEADRLAADLAGTALVLSAGHPVARMMAMSGHKSDASDEGFRSGGDGAAPVASAGDFGAYVRRVDFGPDLRPAATWRSWLGEDVPDDAEMVRFHKGYRKAVSELDPDLVPDILKGLDARGFVGSAACQPCHAEDYRLWKETLHSHAMDILVEKESSRDPDCVPCHLVDVSDAVAKDVGQADTLGVGCEACHGGRAEHVAAAEAGRAGSEPPPPFKANEICTDCHHPPEVTNFDLDVHWPRIEHGRPANSR